MRDISSQEEEIRRLLTAVRNLKVFTERMMNNESPNGIDLDLHWDSWDRTITSNASAISSTGSSPRVNRNRTTRASVTSAESEVLKISPLSPPQSAGPFYTSYVTSPPPSTIKERRATPPPTPPATMRPRSGTNDRKFPTTPPPIKKHQTNLLADPFPLTKSKSHEEHLAHRIEPLDPSVAK